MQENLKKFLNIVNLVLIDVVNMAMTDAREKVEESYKYVHEKITSAEIFASYDGSWLTRGICLQIGFDSIIDVLTGYVLKFEIMSKSCKFCTKSNSDLGEDSPEFYVWYE